MTRLEQRKRYRENYPDRIREQRIRYLDKKLANDPEALRGFDKKLKKDFIRLTRLTLYNEIPKFCERCRIRAEIKILHLRYIYPIDKQNLIFLCENCHTEVGQQTSYPERRDEVLFYNG